MRKLLNTLYITTPGTYLSKEGLALQITRENHPPVTLPTHNLDGIVCFGRVSCSPYLMHFCAQEHIAITFLDEFGRFLARVQGPVSGNVLLRREQYRAADDPVRTEEVVRSILAGKLANSLAVLRRYLADHDKDDADVRRAMEKIRETIQLADNTHGVDSLRGLEGKAAEYYFGVFDKLIIQQKEDFSFTGRTKHPPQDRINAMLSFGYTLLAHEMQSALETIGLDPAVGFLHVDRPGRAGLALDMEEELRAYVVDRMVLSLVNLKHISHKHFEKFPNGVVLLNEDGRKIFIDAWQQRKREELIHPYLNEKMPLGLIFFVQARLMAKFLRGEEDCYVPFLRR